MYLADYNDVFEYEDKKYTIGEIVIGIKGSIYEGQPGVLMEIRDGEDKKTNNAKPDFYCKFTEPILQENKNKINQPNVIKSDSESDWRIVSPDMIISLNELKRQRKKQTVYCLTEDWAYDGNKGEKSYIFTNINDAKTAFELLMCEESEYYGISYFGSDDKFVIEVRENYVKAFVEGNYVESHYELKIEEKEMYISADFYNDRKQNANKKLGG